MPEKAPAPVAPGAWGRRLGLAVGLSVVASQLIAIATWVASTSHPPQGSTNLGWGLYLVIPLEAAGLLAAGAAILVAILARRPWGAGRTILLAFLGTVLLVYAVAASWTIGHNDFAEVRFFFGPKPGVLQILGLAATIVFLGGLGPSLRRPASLPVRLIILCAAAIALAVQAYNWHPAVLGGWTDSWGLVRVIDDIIRPKPYLGPRLPGFPVPGGLFIYSFALATAGLAAAPVLGLVSVVLCERSRGPGRATMVMAHVIAGAMILLAVDRCARGIAGSEPGMLWVPGLFLAALVTFFAGAYLCAACVSAALERAAAWAAPPTTVGG